MKYLNSINNNQEKLVRNVIRSRIRSAKIGPNNVTLYPFQKMVLQTLENGHLGTYFFVVGILDIDGLNKAYLCAEGTPGGEYAANPFWVTINGRVAFGDIGAMIWDNALSHLYSSGTDLEFIFFDSMMGEPDIDTSRAKYLMWKNKTKG